MTPPNSERRYRTIVADPPWEYPDGFAGRSRTPGKWEGPVRRPPLPYPSMTLEQIAALPLADLADADCRLFLWTTNRYLPNAWGLLDGWGFRYKQTLTWMKLDGLNGSVAPNSEFLIVAVKGSPARLSRLPNAVLAHSQTKTHSKKPEMFLDYIEQISPGPYLELFARRNRLGWDTWGNESLEMVQL